MNEQIKMFIGVNVYIDEGIFNFVKWLNGFDSVKTLYSCEGVSIENRPESFLSNEFYPYVIFRCNNEEHLKIILEFLQFSLGTSFNKSRGNFILSVRISPIDKVLDYTIQFTNKNTPNELLMYWEIYREQLENKMKFIPPTLFNS